jgi:hypothetical protein
MKRPIVPFPVINFKGVGLTGMRRRGVHAN